MIAIMIEWPPGEKEPTKYWLSNFPADITIEKLVGTAKMRWYIEHDYEELKQEFGLWHYEGRSWRGFHHHATLCIAAYGFLLRQRWRQKKCSNARCLPYPKVSARAGPVRAQRHVPDSIRSLRLALAIGLVCRLERCACCQQKNFNL